MWSFSHSKLMRGKKLRPPICRLGTALCVSDNKVGLFFKGYIHWVAFSYGISISMDVIVAFDCTKRSFSNIHLPYDFGLLNRFCECGLRYLENC